MQPGAASGGWREKEPVEMDAGTLLLPKRPGDGPGHGL